ncbi:MAG: ATP-binding protein [Bryobacteraceae bacterium]|nr:ATP-binding protein [Bryobacteraceae bacterium]
MHPQFAPICRILKIPFLLNYRTQAGAAFLFGPRQTGKTSLVRAQFPDALYLDFLDAEVSARFDLDPTSLRRQLQSGGHTVVVLDEVQKASRILDEVHWLIENLPVRILMLGSSARKIRREAKNLLGGRAQTVDLFPLVSAEVPDLDLERYLRQGGLPAAYQSNDPMPRLVAYAQTYLKQEIIDEAVTRRIPQFQRFLQCVALSHGRQIQYSNLARESGISRDTAQNYFQVLRDTLVGFDLEPWRESKSRRLIETAKFYLFDIGIANALHPEPLVPMPGTDAFGRAFEHFVIQEVRAYLSYQQKQVPLYYWRTSHGVEVDLIVGQMRLAIECKSSLEVSAKDTKSLRALHQEYPQARRLIVYRGPHRQRTEEGVEVLPWREFCRELWFGELV